MHAAPAEMQRIVNAKILQERESTAQKRFVFEAVAFIKTSLIRSCLIDVSAICVDEAVSSRYSEHLVSDR